MRWEGYWRGLGEPRSGEMASSTWRGVAVVVDVEHDDNEG